MLAPEGRGILLGVLGLNLVFVIGGWAWDLIIFKMGLVFGMFFLVFCGIFFRDPDRIGPEGENLVLAPADGRVVFSGNIRDSLNADENLKQVSIFMTLLDVHANRVPVSGVVTRVKHHTGKFLAAFRDDASEVNEHTEIQIQTGDARVMVRQVAGILARRIICYLREGDRVARGSRFGFIRFGSRADVVLPFGSKILVSVGDRVKGGETVIGELMS